MMYVILFADMTYIELLQKDMGNIEQYKIIGKSQLELLGYKFSKNFINVFADSKKQNPVFILYELVDEDNPKRVAGFTYLYYAEKQSGLVLKNPYNHYIRMLNRSSNGKES